MLRLVALATAGCYTIAHTPQAHHDAYDTAIAEFIGSALIVGVAALDAHNQSTTNGDGAQLMPDVVVGLAGVLLGIGGAITYQASRE